MNNCIDDRNRIKKSAVILDASTGSVTVTNKPIGSPIIDPKVSDHTTGILASRIPPRSIAIPAMASRTRTIGISSTVGNIPAMLATTIADNAKPENPLTIPAKKIAEIQYIN